MNALHLVSHHLCPYVQRAAIVLAEKNIPHQRTYIDLADKPDWFRAASPLGRVPLLQTDGAVLFESQVIAEYLDETTPGSLLPGDALERARHRAWIAFGSETLNAIGAFYSAGDEAVFDAKRAALREKFERIEPEIAGPYFGGEAFGMIDGVWGTVFRYLDVFEAVGDVALLDRLDAATRWRRRIALRPSVIEAAPADYFDRLMRFLARRDSHLGRMAARRVLEPAASA